MRAIDFYGADWCGDCHRAKAALDRFRRSPTAFMISSNEDGAAEKAIAISGQQHIPVIRFADGSWLVEPSATQLQAKCKELGLILIQHCGMPSHEPDKENCLLFGS